MTWPLLALRSLAMIAHAVWFGGFTFYGAVVIPVLHERFGSLDGGLVTGVVADSLNAIGAGAVAIWWVVAWVERRRGPALARRIRLGLLGLTTASLAFLVVDHQILDTRLDRDGLSGFYFHHRIYLIASTIQWAANLGIIPAALAIWGHRPDESRTP